MEGAALVWLLMVLLGLSGISIVILAYYFASTSRQLAEIKKKYGITLEEKYSAMAVQKELQADIQDLKNKLINNVLHDELTGLPGRQIFEDRLKQILTQSKRFDLQFAILFLDIDGFKVINSALGLGIGDQLLKEAAKRLRTCIRQMDTVSRFSGDEFVFIVPQLSKAESAAYVAQRILNALAEPFYINGQELFITGSIGIAIYTTDGNEAALLLKNAENALCQAKTQGGNNYQFYHEGLHTIGRRSFLLSSHLRSTSIYQDLAIYYQPRVNVATQQVICAEVLLHWNHPDFGLILPSELLRLAENTGNMSALGEWLLRQACQQLRNWKKQGSALQAIATTVSLRQLEDPHFIYTIAQILQEAELEPAQLILEISEATFLKKLDLIEKSLRMLKRLGVQVGINDFGTGNIALQHLRRFPIDYLKMTQTLIQGFTLNQESETVIKMIIALANSLQLWLIAEGVESEKTKEKLKNLGCNLMQGTVFSAPLLAKDFTKFIEKTVAKSE